MELVEIHDALYPYFDKCNICYRKNDISNPSDEFI